MQVQASPKSTKRQRSVTCTPGSTAVMYHETTCPCLHLHLNLTYALTSSVLQTPARSNVLKVLQGNAASTPAPACLAGGLTD